jgi:guanine deaminase
MACLLRHGTTTAMYFATIHVDATCALADACVAVGQRAFVGKVNMDRHGPADYCETTLQSLEGSAEVTRRVRASQRGEPVEHHLVRPVLTPRFVPTCSPELLRGLGAMAAMDPHGIRVQSHISESDGEVAFTARLHDGQRDAALLDQVGRCNLNR